MDTAHRLALVAAVVLMAVGQGCQSKDEPMPAATRSMTLTSAAFTAGGKIDKRFTADGEDLSPPLAWDGVPEEAQEFAILCDDPDAPTPQPWVHWVLYKLPAELRAITEGISAKPRLESPTGALRGANSWSSGRTIGYRGPAPPKGTHRYFFRLYALDTRLDVEPGLTKDQLLRAMKGQVLAQGELMGTYTR